jgi:tetratricopeptide (TPR) repeat protein
MPIVQAKCENCGGILAVDSSLEAAVCPFCSTPYVVEKAINNYNIINNNNFDGATINVTGGNVDNLLKMAETAVDASNGQEAINYANKVLEIDPESSRAWYIKMRALENLATVGDAKLEETIKCGDNAIQYALDEDKEKITIKVYKHYLYRAQNIMLVAIEKMKDTGHLKDIAKLGLSAAKGAAEGDSAIIKIYDTMVLNAQLFKLKVPIEYIDEDESIRMDVTILAKSYVTYLTAYADRVGIYYLHITDSGMESLQTKLDIFKRGLPEEVANDINLKNLIESNNKKKDGCYVATAVYGSYDCPQVWTLRRYRDYRLDSTWYGRLFIMIYYAISPTLVKWFGETKWFKKMWKSKLDRMVERLKAEGYEDTPYNDKY